MLPGVRGSHPASDPWASPRNPLRKQVTGLQKVPGSSPLRPKPWEQRVPWEPELCTLWRQESSSELGRVFTQSHRGEEQHSPAQSASGAGGAFPLIKGPAGCASTPSLRRLGRPCSAECEIPLASLGRVLEDSQNTGTSASVVASKYHGGLGWGLGDHICALFSPCAHHRGPRHCLAPDG